MFDRVKDNATIEISGRTWNEINGRLNRIESRIINNGNRPQGLRDLMVRNDTGRDVPPFEIVSINDPATLPGTVPQDVGYRFQNVFVGGSTDTETTRFGVLQKGMPNDMGNNTPGVACVKTSGVTTAVVNVITVGDKYARPSATDGQLESTSTATPTEIIYSTGTGVQDCKVMLGTSTSTPPLIGVTTADISFGSSGGINLLASGNAGTLPTANGQAVTAYHDLLDATPVIHAGTNVIVETAEHGRLRIVEIATNKVWKATALSDAESGSSGSFEITIKGGVRTVGAVALSSLGSGDSVIVFVGGDNVFYAQGSSGGGSNALIYRGEAVNDVLRGATGLFSVNGLGADINATSLDHVLSGTPAVVFRGADGIFYASANKSIWRGDATEDIEDDVFGEVSLRVTDSGGQLIQARGVGFIKKDQPCVVFLSENGDLFAVAGQEKCPTGLLEGVSYPGRLSPSASSSSGTTTVEVYLEGSVLTDGQKITIGAAPHAVSASWWADVCPIPNQHVMVHVVNCQLFATASIHLDRTLETAGPDAKVLGVENGCVVEFETDESCSEASQ